MIASKIDQDRAEIIDNARDQYLVVVKEMIVLLVA